MLKDILLNNLNLNADSKAVKVFLFPRTLKSKPEANGCVRFNLSHLEQHRHIFDKFVAQNGFSQGSEHVWHEFAADGERVWAKSKDEVLFLMAALEILGYGNVIANTENDEILIGQGFNNVPRFKFNAE